MRFSLQLCRLLEVILKVLLVSSPLNSWATIMIPAQPLAAVMERCGAPSPKALMMIASGASVLTKVFFFVLYCLYNYCLLNIQYLRAVSTEAFDTAESSRSSPENSNCRLQWNAGAERGKCRAR